MNEQCFMFNENKDSIYKLENVSYNNKFLI